MAFTRPRSNFQPCETFFVEDDYHRARADRQAKQEHDKLVARERQYVIADQLSRLTSEELRDDVLKHMLDMDVSTLFPSMTLGIPTYLVIDRAKLFPMWNRSIFKPRFSGSCVRTSLTS